MTVRINVKWLAHGAGLPLPRQQTAGAAGLDLCAAIDAEETLTIAPGDYALVPTGLSIALPEGYEAQIRPRSGLAAKHGVTVLNSPGTVDADIHYNCFSGEPWASARHDLPTGVDSKSWIEWAR